MEDDRYQPGLVDTFHDRRRRGTQAVADVVAALVRDGLTVTVLIDNPGFARLSVEDPGTGAVSNVELRNDGRAHPPVVLEIGPMLHPDDAVAKKVNAPYSRAQVRDDIDVDACCDPSATRGRIC